ncbi:MAG: radical SAM protein [Ignavibacteriales bacterium]|nr:radical SAM protein [Ignavibacteriales bacterium]
MVEIKGIEKFSSRDFPGHISSTVFFGGCTFRCPYCHNSQLVLEPETIQSMAADYFLSYLDGRKGWLEAVCLTGGEPLLHEDIEDIIRVVRERGLLVKLDTNGSFPDRLEALLGPRPPRPRGHGRQGPARALPRGHPVDDRPREDRPERRSRPELRHALPVPDDGRPGLRRHRTTSSRSASGSTGPRATPSSSSCPRRRSIPPSWTIKPFGRAELEDIAAAARPYFGEVRDRGPD